MLPLMLALAFADEPPPEERLIRVPVAAHDLRVGHRLDVEDIDLVRYLPDYVPGEAITEPEAAFGRVLRERIYEGELLRPERFAPSEAADGLAGVVPRGMQLLRLEPTLPTPPIAPASYVDVLDGTRFCVVAEAVTVLGVEGLEGHIDTLLVPDTTVAWHLAVTPAQAKELLALSTYTLALRWEADVTSVPAVLCDAEPEPAPE